MVVSFGKRGDKGGESGNHGRKVDGSDNGRGQEFIN
jgi:hypothetical protein